MIRAFAVVCITAACAALPAVAAAKPAKQQGPQQAEFKAVLKGSQVTTWTYNRPYNDDEPCLAPGQGYGDSSIYFGSNNPLKLKFVAPPKDAPNLFSSRGRPVVVTDPSPYRLHSRASRDTDIDYGQPGTKCEGENGGGVEPDLRPKDCGERTGTIGARFFFDHRSIFDDAIPTDHEKRDKNRLKLQTFDPDYSGGALEDAYENCELSNLTTVEHQGTTYTIGGKLNEKQLFNKKRKTIRVSGSYITPVEGEYYNGKTILAWNLKLTRIK
jgi:hypothetical protein